MACVSARTFDIVLIAENMMHALDSRTFSFANITGGSRGKYSIRSD